MDKIEQAKETLRQAGYFVDALWHLDDVRKEFKCDDDTAWEILESAVTQPKAFEVVNDEIYDIGKNDFNLEDNFDGHLN